MSKTEFPPVEALMPHRGEILLLDRILEHDAEHTVARVDVATQRWLEREDGSVAPWLGIEYMAQCLAAHEGLLALEQGRPLPLGFLVKANDVRLHIQRFEPDAVLRVQTRRVRGRPGLGMLSHECSVRSEDGKAPLVEGRLSVSVPKNQQLSDSKPAVPGA